MAKKVAVAFYCTKSKKSYKVGDTYKGKRTDIPQVFEGYVADNTDPDRPDKPKDKS